MSIQIDRNAWFPVRLAQCMGRFFEGCFRACCKRERETEQCNLDDLQTGDIMFFGGDDDLSRFLKVVTVGDFSHAAYIVRLPGDETVHLCHSTQFDSAGLGRNGTFLIPLEVEMTHQKQMAVRKLLPPATEQEKEGVIACYKKWEGTPYSEDQITANSCMDCEDLFPCCTCCLNRESKIQKSSFCSEIVVAMLQDIGRVPKTDAYGYPIYAAEATPADIQAMRNNSVGPLVHLRHELLGTGPQGSKKLFRIERLAKHMKAPAEGEAAH